MGSGAKSYKRKGFLIYSMWKCANISPYMSRPLVKYDFATDPSEFPHLIYEFYFHIFISVPTEV